LLLDEDDFFYTELNGFDIIYNYSTGHDITELRDEYK